jgi:UDPglucose 6-dehydrogenase
MLATKISFINEIAALCDRLDVDVENVRRGIGSDQRIGFHFIYPGCGYGGSCFPKDVKALVHTAEMNDFQPTLLHAVEARNQAQRRILFDKIVTRFGADLKGKSFAIWGLAFKPGTDDMREASAEVLIRLLLDAGARVRAYDPVAMEVARGLFPSAWFNEGRLTLVDHQYAALEGVDALALVTEWKPFRSPDFIAMKKLMASPLIFDGRNQYHPPEVVEAGFEYFGIGRRG